MAHEEIPPVDDAPPPAPAQLLELAREQVRLGRHRDAALVLARLLALDPLHADANALMAELYFGTQRIGEAGVFTTAALAAMPDNPRLHVLHGEMHRANGRPAQAEAAFAQALALDRKRLGAWTGRIAVALEQRQWMHAVDLLREALAETGEAAPWANVTRALREAGAIVPLRAAVALLPVPGSSDPPRFLAWLRELHGAGDGVRVRAALAGLPENWTAAQRAEGRGMLAEIAFAAGDFPLALGERRLALAELPADRGLRRQVLRALLYVGDLDGAEQELVTLAAGRAPQDDLIGEVALLQAARMSRPAMQSLRAAYAAADAPAAETLAHVVNEDPGCSHAAIAFIAALRRRAGAVAGAGGGPGVPPHFWSLDAAVDSWHLHHPGARWHALAYAPLPVEIASALPLSTQALKRLPWELQVDLLRMTTLWRAGGWWFPAQRPCHGNLPALAGAGATLFLVCDGQGWLSPECIGCCAGDAAMTSVQALVVEGLRGVHPRGATPAAVLLTCGVARALAGRLLRGDALADVRIVAEAEFRVVVA